MISGLTHLGLDSDRLRNRPGTGGTGRVGTSQDVRWLGVAIAAAKAILQLLFIPAYPFRSLCLFTLDILVIYGLIVHGHRAEA